MMLLQRQKQIRRWVSSSIRQQQQGFVTTPAVSSSSSTETICELAASNLRFGAGAVSEIGMTLSESFQAKRIVLFTDSTLKNLLLPQVMEYLSSDTSKIEEVIVYDQVRIEPNTASFQHAIDFLKNQSSDYDAIVALGGGSVIDTAKAANLYACHPTADFYDFVNPPIGRGLPIPEKQGLKPLIAIPTTAGTGSETTGVAIFDDIATKSKTGIASRQLKPTLGIVDANLTATLPKKVALYSGLDVLCHALESYTALAYTKRTKPTSPALRPAYQGSNPISDIWSLFALRTCAENLPRIAQDPTDIHARSQMLLASSAAGMGFGNAGVHLCHGMSYPISSQVSNYIPGEGYPTTEKALIPHGLSVIVTAPAVFRFTQSACPERQDHCAEILNRARNNNESSSSRHATSSLSSSLSDEIEHLCQELKVPMGLQTFGYSTDDIPDLVEGTLPQHRVTKISPRQPVGRKELESLFLDTFR